MLRDLRPDISAVGVDAPPPPAEVLVAQALGSLEPPGQFPVQLDPLRVPLAHSVHATEEGDIITEARAHEMLQAASVRGGQRPLMLSRMVVEPLTEEENLRAMAVGRSMHNDPAIEPPPSNPLCLCCCSFACSSPEVCRICLCGPHQPSQLFAELVAAFDAGLLS